MVAVTEPGARSELLPLTAWLGLLAGILRDLAAHPGRTDPQADLALADQADYGVRLLTQVDLWAGDFSRRLTARLTRATDHTP